MLTRDKLRFLVLALVCAALPAAPQSQQNIPGPLGQHSQSPFATPSDDDNVFAHRQLNALNAERQKALVSDAAKLLKLAQELNAEIATSKSDSLSSEQMRKIANIEKLARNVKQKMSESVISGPSMHDPIIPVR
jgi:hypothetical protein